MPVLSLDNHSKYGMIETDGGYSQITTIVVVAVLEKRIARELRKKQANNFYCRHNKSCRGHCRIFVFLRRLLSACWEMPSMVAAVVWLLPAWCMAFLMRLCVASCMVGRGISCGGNEKEDESFAWSFVSIVRVCDIWLRKALSERVLFVFWAMASNTIACNSLILPGKL